jgi:hypothetical protein
VEQQHRGLFTFQFFKHGAWRQVVVDNRLPCLEVQQRLAFASSTTPQVRPTCLSDAQAHYHCACACPLLYAVASVMQACGFGLESFARHCIITSNSQQHGLS